MNNNHDLQIALYLKFTEESGDTFFYDQESIEDFCYDNLIYIKDKKTFIKISQPDTVKEKFNGQYKKIVPNYEIPKLLEKFGDDWWDDGNIVDDSVKNLKIYKTFDQIYYTKK